MPKQTLPSAIGPYAFYTQGTQVTWDSDKWQTGNVNSGTIVGFAAQPMPVLGAQYIIAANGRFGPKYPYTHFSLPECALTELTLK